MKRTPLKPSRKPLQRRTRLKATKTLARSTRLPQRRTEPRRRADGHLVDHEYREWLRRQPCCAPGCTQKGPRVIQAHHHTGHEHGRGQKGSDRYMMALCVLDHTPGLHALAGRFKGWTREQLQSWQDEQAEAHWRRYQAQALKPATQHVVLTPSNPAPPGVSE